MKDEIPRLAAQVDSASFLHWDNLFARHLVEISRVAGNGIDHGRTAGHTVNRKGHRAVTGYIICHLRYLSGIGIEPIRHAIPFQCDCYVLQYLLNALVIVPLSIVHHSGVIGIGVVEQIIVVGTIRDILVHGSLKPGHIILCIAGYSKRIQRL